MEKLAMTRKARRGAGGVAGLFALVLALLCLPGPAWAGYDDSSGHNVPTGWGSAQNVRVYSDATDDAIYFDGSKNRTRYRWVGSSTRSDGDLAFCLNPALWGATNTEDSKVTSLVSKMRRLSASDFATKAQYEAFCAALYYGCGGPGYSSLGKNWYPSADYKGGSLSYKERFAATHVLLGHYFNGCSKAKTFDAATGQSQSNHDPADEYWDWFKKHFINASTAKSKTAAQFGKKAYGYFTDADMLAHGGWTVAEWEQHVWLVNVGLKSDGTKRNNYGNYQMLVFAESKPSNSITASVAKKSADTGTSGGNALYSLAGAQYAVYSDAALKDKVGTITTDAKGAGSLTLKKLEATTYYAKETKASPGFLPDSQTHAIAMKLGAAPAYGKASAYTGSFSSSEPPAHLAVHAEKRDAAAGTALAGAKFTLKWYAGDYGSISALPAKAGKTVTLTSGADGKTGSADLPLGTYTIQETAAPAGYRLDSTVYLGKISYDASASSGAKAVAVAPAAFKSLGVGGGVLVKMPDEPKLFGISVEKRDATTEDGAPPEGMSLAGAEFAVENASGGTVVVGGRSYAKGAVVATVKTRHEDGRYVASTGKVLPAGTYTVRETVAPAGYALDRDWAQDVTVGGSDEDGHVYQVSCEDAELSGEVALRARKTLLDADGAGKLAVQEGQFAFELLDEAGNRVSTAACGADGLAEFPAIGLAWTDVGKTFHYRIRELSAAEAGIAQEGYALDFRDIAYDGETVDVAVTVEAGEAALECEAAYSRGGDAAAFTNTRKLPYEVTAAKAFEDGELAGGDFSFILRDAAGAEVARAENAADGSISFGRMQWSDAREGDELAFTIEEERAFKPYVEFDGGKVEVRVKAVREDGMLAARVSYAKVDGETGESTAVADGEAATFVNRQVKVELPLTGGDGPGAAAFVAPAGAVAAAVLAGIWLLRRRRAGGAWG